MADNTTLNPGSGGDVSASNDIGGVKYQRVKLSIGAPGSATDASLAAPVPVRPGTYGTNGSSRINVTNASGGTSLASSSSTRVGMRVVNRDTAVRVAIVLHASTAGTSFAAAIAETILSPGDEWSMDHPVWAGAVYAISESGTSIPLDVTDKTP